MVEQENEGDTPRNVNKDDVMARAVLNKKSLPQTLSWEKMTMQRSCVIFCDDFLILTDSMPMVSNLGGSLR